MRYVKRQTTNRATVNGKGIIFDVNGQVVMDSTDMMLVPKGTDANVVTSYTEGHIRYNTDSNEFECYQNGALRKMRFKEPTTITQQSLGNGDATITMFGPLDSGDTDYVEPAAAQNVLVLVENVFQLATTNYALVQNPSSASTGQEITAGSFVTSTEYIITTTGTTNFTLIGAANSSPGTVFTATGAGSGDGTARPTGYYLEFTSAPDVGKPVTVLHNFDK
jgi:hypothetical protein